MKKHTVFVAGKRFVLVSDDKEEYVQKIAQEINDSIIKISTSFPTMDSRACAILCALDQADDKYKEVLKNQRFSEKAKEVMTQSDKHAKSIVDLKNELQKSRKLNEQQLRQIADKNVEIKDLSNKVKDISGENVKLKEENKKLNDEIAKLREKLENQKNPQTKNEVKQPLKDKKQPYQNPVAKVKKPTETVAKKTTTEEKISLNQMSLFENE